MGYAGMVSFGHSAFFGVGGYVARARCSSSRPALVSRSLLSRRWPPALRALVIGFFSIRVSGVYFIMLTLAFSQMFYAVAFQAAWLGAEDGIVGVPRPSVLGVEPGEPRGLSRSTSWCSLARSPRSSSGASCARRSATCSRGIHDNEARMQAVGYPVEPLQAPGLRHRRASWRASPARSTRSSSAPSRPTRSCGRPPARSCSWSSSAALGTLGGAVPGRRRLHPAAEPGQLLHRALDAHPRADASSSSCSSRPGGIVGALRGRVGSAA